MTTTDELQQSAEASVNEVTEEYESVQQLYTRTYTEFDKLRYKNNHCNHHIYDRTCNYKMDS